MPEVHLRHFKETLWRSYPQSLIASPQSMDLLDLVDRILGSFNIQGSLQIVKNLLEEMGQEQLVLNLQELCVQSMYIPFYSSDVFKSKSFLNPLFIILNVSCLHIGRSN
jgi:hypothetical protein